MLKYRTTLNDFRNRMKVFRNEKDVKRQSNANRIDNYLKKLLFVNANMDDSFYRKMLEYHKLSSKELASSNVVDINWIN